MLHVRKNSSTSLTEFRIKEALPNALDRILHEILETVHTKKVFSYTFIML